MKPTEQLKQKALEEGAIERACEIYAVSHVLHAVASYFEEIGNETLERYGLVIGSLKHKLNMYEKAKNAYFTMMQDFVEKESVTGFFKDMDQIIENTWAWSGVPKEWQPMKKTQSEK